MTPSVDHLGNAADVRGDDRHLAGHRLERGQPETLLGRGQEKYVGRGQERHDPILLAEKLDAVTEPERARLLRRGARGRGRRRPSAAAPASDARIRAKISTTAATRFTGRKFDT